MPKSVDRPEELVAMGRRIKIAREAARLTQKQLGDLIEMDAQNVSKIENGKQATSSTIIREICVHLAVSADWLLRGIGDGPSPSTPIYDSLAGYLDSGPVDDAAREFLLRQPDPGFDPGVLFWAALHKIWLGVQDLRARGTQPPTPVRQ